MSWPPGVHKNHCITLGTNTCSLRFYAFITLVRRQAYDASLIIFPAQIYVVCMLFSFHLTHDTPFIQETSAVSFINFFHLSCRKRLYTCKYISMCVCIYSIIMYQERDELLNVHVCNNIVENMCCHLFIPKGRLGQQNI